MKFINLIRQKFGRLKVLKRVGNNKYGSSRWLCLCNCGKETIVLGNSLTSSTTQSCGCLRREESAERAKIKIKHGHSRKRKLSGIYTTWQNMTQRCINSNRKDYCLYGGRGIKVCKRWLEFENFLKDMPGWKSGLTLERTDRNGNYCPENCNWATRKEQARNRRTNRLITCFGKTQSLIEWSEETGIPYTTLRNRFHYGWTAEEALTIPVKRYKKGKKKNET
jgi:hypothetical protein